MKKFLRRFLCWFTHPAAGFMLGATSGYELHQVGYGGIYLCKCRRCGAVFSVQR